MYRAEWFYGGVGQAKCDETIARVELMVKNLDAQMDIKTVVQGIQTALDKGIKAEIISPFVQQSKELGERVLPTLKKIEAASSQAHTLWREHIWRTAWAGSFLLTFVLFGLATLGIYTKFDGYAERKAAEKIDEVSRLMEYNQEAFRQLAIAQVPIQVVRSQSYGVINPRGFAVIVEGADSVETRNEDGGKNGYTFFSSQLSEEQIQALQAQLPKTKGNSK